MLIVDIAAGIAHQVTCCSSDFSSKGFDVSSLLESGTSTLRCSSLLQSTRSPVCRCLRTQSSDDAMRGSHRGSPFGRGLDVIQKYTDRITTSGAISGALNAHCPATIKKDPCLVHIEQPKYMMVGGSVGRRILLPICRAEWNIKPAICRSCDVFSVSAIPILTYELESILFRSLKHREKFSASIGANHLLKPVLSQEAHN